MLSTFPTVDDVTTKTSKAERFHQCTGETICSYSDRFKLEIVETYPTYVLNDVLWMQIFS